MARAATGTVAWRWSAEHGRDCWHARFTRGDGTRTAWHALDPNIPEADREGARACAARFASVAKTSTRDGAGELVATYVERWLADRKTRLVSIKDDHQRLRDHVLPLIGRRSVIALNRDDVEGVRDALDAKVTAGTLTWKTARLAWAVLRTLCNDLVNARRKELRVRDDNPAAGVKPTLSGATKLKSYLYPSEFLRFVDCASVPRDWRVAVALALYTYGRDGEVSMLDWKDVDLEHGTMTIARGRDRETGKAKSTKTGVARRFAVEPNLLPMLRAMHTAAKGKGRVFDLDATHMSRTFRRWLLVAGVDRPALHDRTEATRPITWHDLRASAATWAAVRGDKPLAIQQRCGHASFSTTAIYIREAEALTEGFGDPFPAFRHPFASDDSHLTKTLRNKGNSERDTRFEAEAPSAALALVLPRETHIGARGQSSRDDDRSTQISASPVALVTIREALADALRGDPLPACRILQQLIDQEEVKREPRVNVTSLATWRTRRG